MVTMVTSMYRWRQACNDHTPIVTPTLTTRVFLLLDEDTGEGALLCVFAGYFSAFPPLTIHTGTQQSHTCTNSNAHTRR